MKLLDRIHGKAHSEVNPDLRDHEKRIWVAGFHAGFLAMNKENCPFRKRSEEYPIWMSGYERGKKDTTFKRSWQVIDA